MISFYLGCKKIGLSYPVYFIADIAANHDGSLQRAKRLIYLAAKSGANAVKFQNFSTDKIVSKFGFEQIGGNLSHQKSWNKSVYEVFRQASINSDWTPILSQTCKKAGIEYLTSPYDFDSVDRVNQYLTAYKIGSGDITWLEIIDYIAKKGKPVILATGSSTISDVRRAMTVLMKRINKIILMQCNTNYTASVKNFKYINLFVLKLYEKLYPDVILGLSDHTHGHSTVLGAVTIGARVIEKHFTDDNRRRGPDHFFAMNPKTWKEMVERTRELEAALGDGIKKVEVNEKETAIVQRRSLRAAHNLKIGDILKKSDLEPLRPIPNDGIPPFKIDKLLGKKLKKILQKGEHITWRDV